MRKMEGKSSLLESQHEVQGKVRKLLRGMLLNQKLAMLKAPELLSELRPSERREALHAIKQRDQRAELDVIWLASFLKVLRALKAEEKRVDAE